MKFLFFIALNCQSILRNKLNFAISKKGGHVPGHSHFRSVVIVEISSSVKSKSSPFHSEHVFQSF